MNSPTASPPKAPEAEAQVDPIKEANRAKFELELEFVQALANPYYLHSLAQQNILEQPAFVNYLKYLLYWKEKDYARFIHYPHALHNLELLQHAEFRTRLKKEESLRDSLHQKQFDHWRTWRDPSSWKGSNPEAQGTQHASVSGEAGSELRTA